MPAVDAPVDDADDVYRLVKVDDCNAVDGRWEFQSNAFDNATPFHDGERNDEMSVVLGDTLSALDRAPENLPAESPFPGDPERWGVARLNAGFLRSQMQEILRTPTEDEPAHGDVRGSKNSGCRKRLKKHARWVVEPQIVPE
ncbi:MAG: hypothetical protein H0X28_11425 [Solirubrobacterales bacterium]|nr:hypothetical protein [Solirubrobacterales bacterium]